LQTRRAQPVGYRSDKPIEPAGRLGQLASFLNEPLAILPALPIGFSRKLSD